jgi:L-ascorbate metabolism protein UlaG (beta-lactamase superfamily)
VAGDTENTPEMKGLRNIDVAFLPMSLPYTMDSAMAADAAKAFKPKILYPYHTLFSEDQVSGFVESMKGTDDVEIRVSE